VTDGGQISPQDIAAATSNHVESVRRALRRIDDLVQREYGEVALRSSYIAELVYEGAEEARESTRKAVEVSVPYEPQSVESTNECMARVGTAR
jgi:hypothetical protein